MNKLKRTGLLLAGFLMMAGLSGCATVDYPLAEPSIMQSIAGFFVRSYEVHDCEKSAPTYNDCSAAEKSNCGRRRVVDGYCTASAIQARKDEKRGKRDARRVATGELIPVEQLPESLGQEPQSSVPANPNTPAIDDGLEPSVVILPEYSFE